MQNALQNLTVDEIEELSLIPVWVSILIASSDDKIDRFELKKAIQVAIDKQATEDRLIIGYYKKVAEKFEINLKGYIALMPSDNIKRTNFLVSKLERVNYLFSLLEKDFSYQLYLSFRDFAKKVADASGGIFGLLSVSTKASKYIGLEMISDPTKSIV